MRINFTYLFSFIILNISCQFETTIEVNLPELTKTISVTGHLTQADTLHKIFVSQSFSFLDTQSYDGLKNATVQIFKNGENFKNFAYNDQEKAYFSEAFLKEEDENITYQLRVSTPDFQSISAEQTLPMKVPISNISVNKDINTEGLDELIITFEDTKNDKNFYFLQVITEKEFILDQDTIIEQSIGGAEEIAEPILKTIGQNQGELGLLFNDGTFDGQKKDLRLYYNFSSLAKKLIIHLHSITEDAYLFYESYQRYYDIGNDLFAEPVVVHENIEEGHGIFSLATVDTIIIEL